MFDDDGAGQPPASHPIPPGSGSPPLLRGPVFFAIYVVPDATAQMSQLRQSLCGQHGLAGRPIAPERLHATLLYIGDVPALAEETVRAARKAAATIMLQPFAVAFDWVESFRNGRPERPVVLSGSDGTARLMLLQRALSGAMKRAGLVLPRHGAFTPHVTLLWDRPAVPKTRLDAPIGWTVCEFALVHSLLGKSKHVEIDRWPLRG